MHTSGMRKGGARCTCGMASDPCWGLNPKEVFCSEDEWERAAFGGEGRSFFANREGSEPRRLVAAVLKEEGVGNECWRSYLPRPAGAFSCFAGTGNEWREQAGFRTVQQRFPSPGWNAATVSGGRGYARALSVGQTGTRRGSYPSGHRLRSGRSASLCCTSRHSRSGLRLRGASAAFGDWAFRRALPPSSWGLCPCRGNPWW